MDTQRRIHPMRMAALLILAMTALTFGGWTGAAPAAAHGGELQIDLGTDGAGGIDALVVWAGDEHPVEESVDIKIAAVSDDGEEVGPVRLESAPEGVGWYTSEPGLLGEGHWTVTATTTEPQEHETTTELDVAAPPEPPAENPPAAAEDEASAQQDEAAEASGGLGAGTAWLWGGIGVVTLVGVAAVVLRVRRMRSN
ncbi:hypothetical protein [Microbacterium halotolerans]|uniref:hypothetical protein n=1 Tax=Microbacterium halotolerans TaxID=246613 RepID=UPI0013C33479|nr:hypothetical protein [Microbacterium halotolerans]